MHAWVESGTARVAPVSVGDPQTTALPGLVVSVTTEYPDWSRENIHAESISAVCRSEDESIDT
jgi:hypothetical protein